MTNLKRAFKYRIYPTEEQEAVLNKRLEESRLLYNLLLDASIKAYKDDNKRLLGYDLMKAALKIRKDKGFIDLNAQSTQNIADRVTKSFKNFFRRVKDGKRGKVVGYPRFKQFGRYESMTFPQYSNGFKLLDENLLSVSKLGIFKIKYLKDIDGKLKTLTLKKEATGNWYAVMICEGCAIKRQMTESEKAVGIDVGIDSIIATSEGTKIANPKILQRSEIILDRRHRQLSKKQKGSKNRNKARIKLAKVYSRISKERETFIHGLTNKLTGEYKIIVLEKLQINNMVKNHRLSKSINDASWGELARQLSYKAEEAGSIFLQVDPKDTSKKCSECGWKDEDQTLADRIFKCKNCGLELDRDINASKNILKIGLNTLSRREINAYGDESSTTKAAATIANEIGKSRSGHICRFRDY